MEEEKKSKWEVAQTNETVKTKSFIIKYIIFVIILISITVIGIVFSIKHIDKTIGQAEILEESELESSEKIEEPKKLAEDSSYGIKSYSETYDTNSIEIKKYNDTEGKIVKETQETRTQAAINPIDFKYNISFIQIDGLKNKDVQDKINAKLKNVPYTLAKEKHVWSAVTANFSNVLSVVITNDISYGDDAKTLNFDLTTGEEISFEKLFVSSAPIKSMIASGLYKSFAWNKLNEDYEKFEGFYDMKNADTSEIEEQILLATKKYDKIKDEIIFSFSPTSINIHNPELRTQIDMLEYANEIAIYKRYLTNQSIYEKDDLGTKGTIVFTEDITVYDDYVKNISYGKITNNIFVEEILLKFDESIHDEDMKIITDYVNKLSTERKTILKQETPNDKGVIFQGQYHVYKVDKGYYCINVSYNKAQCSISYFKEKAFRDYAEIKGKDRVEVGINAFETYMQEDYPEMQISEGEYKTYYLSPTGEFLGNTIEEVESKAWE